MCSALCWISMGTTNICLEIIIIIKIEPHQCYLIIFDFLNCYSVDLKNVILCVFMMMQGCPWPKTRNINVDFQLNLFKLLLPVWYDSPTVTALDTMTYPIEELTFPTITICPQNSNPDRWGPTIKTFDNLEKRCPNTG